MDGGPDLGLDGWMDGCMHACMDGWMDGWMDGSTWTATSTSTTTMTMDVWVERSIGGSSGDLLLQMDIEGAEFETLLNTSSELLERFRIMVIEFHYLHQLWNKPWFILVSRVFQKLLSSHSVVHIHPNNCCGSLKSGGFELPRVAEFTFYRNDMFTERRFCDRFPHPLDCDNTSKSALVLPRCWYGS